jgi:hypothetical protein
MQIFCHSLVGGTLVLEVEKDITVKELKELVRLKLEGVTAEHTITLTRNDLPEIKDTDMLVVTKHQGGIEPVPYFQTETKQVHLSGAGFFVIAKAPSASLVALTDLFKSSNTAGKGNQEHTATNNVRQEKGCCIC